MNEENDTSVSTEQLSTETKPASPFNADGTLVENWHTLAPEGYEHLREDKTLPRIKKFWDLSSSYVNVRKQVPLDKMPRPNDNFSEADWDEFYKAGGRPDTPQDFNIKKPEDFPEEYWVQDNADKYQEVFHKLGISKKQSDALVALNNEMTLAAIKEIEQQEEMEFTTLKDNLRKKWGRAFDQNTHLGDIAIEKGAKGDEGFKERLIEKINKDPDLIEYSANLGSLFSEHEIFEDTKIPTPSDIQKQINELRADPRFLSKEKSIRQPLIDQINRLTEQMLKDKAG